LNAFLLIFWSFVMKDTHTIVVTLSLLLSCALMPAWGGPPPNPTQSDIKHNTAGGTGVLNVNTGLQNTGFGSLALFRNTTGGRNTAFGYPALANNTTGEGNTATGFNVLGSNKTGSNNTASGFDAMAYSVSGNFNTAMGIFAELSNTSGSYNTAIGHYALGSNKTGNGNLALGAASGLSLVRGSNNIYLASRGKSNESATIRIGDVQKRAFIEGVRGVKTGLANGVPVYIDSNGQLGTINSSARFKENIRDMGEASQHLLQLHPVTYQYKQATEDGNKPLEYGLIAEEVQKVYPDLVAYNGKGEVETVQYHKLTPMLLNEMQRLHKQNVAQAKEIAALKQQVQAMQSQAQHLDALTVRLEQLEQVPATLRVADVMP
jgi:Chaperone of endosialidase